MNYYYPFNRTFKFWMNHDEFVLSITGQIIDKKQINFNVLPDRDEFELQNKHIYEPSYLIRYELGNLQRYSLGYLLKEKKLTHDDIVRAAQILREKIWGVLDELIEIESEDTNYYTGLYLEKPVFPIAYKSFEKQDYRSWIIYSDIYALLECFAEDWLDKRRWCSSNEPWSMDEVYSVLTLWMIDEATIYLNHNLTHKASIWLLRANQFFNDVEIYNLQVTNNQIRQIASLGGQAKKRKYDPLKEFVVKLATERKYQSRRNAAYSIVENVHQKAKELNLGLSPLQAPLTIMKWLKDAGL